MSQVFSIDTAQDVCFVVYFVLLFLSIKFTPRQLTIHIFILDVMFFLSDAWVMFSVFFAPMLLYTSHQSL